MKVLLTGANGFLGHYLTRQLFDKNIEVIATGKNDCRLPFVGQLGFQYVSMDFTDPYSSHDVFEKFQPEVVIHAGAMTKPDDCEQNQWQSYVVNTEGTLNMLMNAGEHKSFFIFISTDFIFDGEADQYKEEDAGNPVNFYGKTKLEAEEAVKEYQYDWSIVRTVLVYGKPQSGKGNILTVVKDKLEKGEGYSVFDDQTRTPTYVEDLAAGIVSIIEKRATGIYHLSGTDMVSPYQMACMVADHLKLDRSLLKKVTAATFSQPAKRPPKTIFNIDKARNELGYNPVSFMEGLAKTLDNR